MLKRIKTKINGKDAEFIYSPEMDKLRDKLYSSQGVKKEKKVDKKHMED